MTKTLTATDDSPKWYFVDLPDLPSPERLKSQGIVLATTSFISRGFYNLFLSGSQVRFLVDECDAEVSEVKDKLIDGTVPLHSADYLIVEVAKSFDPSLHQTEWFHLGRVTSTGYFVQGSDIKRMSSYFANLNEVYSITPAHYPKAKNFLGAGYSQLNTKRLDATNSFQRYLQEQGLTGEGVVVAVIDTRLDLQSTFFYDPENPVPGRNHRKVLADVGGTDLGNSSHGTHVAGTIAGNSTNANASRYNGIAPLAKIIQLPLLNEKEAWAGVLAIEEQYMKQFDCHIATNSWGDDHFQVTYINMLDTRAAAQPSFLYLFAAGNEQAKDWYKTDKYMTLSSPAPSKNVVTVGALGMLSVDTLPSENRIRFQLKLEDPRGEFGFYPKLLDVGTNPFVQASDYVPESVTYVMNESDWVNSQTQEDVQCVITFVPVNGTKRSYPVFYIDDPAAIKVREYFLTVPEKPTYEAYYEFRLTNPGLADFSSKGPSMVGIIKPDVVAPGTHILSAGSKSNGTAEHDINPLTVGAMSGTSMATPNVAGAAALIQQYFRSGVFYDRIVQPTGRFLKGMLIHCADPIPADRKFPNNEFGFGQINLGAYLPFENSSFSIVVNETVSISALQHLVGNVSVLSNATAFRVTMSYLDAALSADSLIPLQMDLDLIVISKTGKIFRGNHYLNGSEERFSTTERVIVNPDEIEVGDYEIHVLGLFQGDNVSFSIITTGVLSKNQTKIELAPATSCIPCGNGTCLVARGFCQCGSSPPRFGHSCQIQVHEIPVSQGLENQTFTVPPLESLYVRVTNPSNVSNYTVHVSGNSRIVLRLFVHPLQTSAESPMGFPSGYSLPVWNNVSEPSEWERNFSSPMVEVMIRNEFSVPWGFRVWTKPIVQAPTIAPPVPPGPGTLSRSSTNSSDNASTGLSGGIVAVIVIVPVVVVAAAVVIVVFLLRRRNDGISRFDGP